MKIENAVKLAQKHGQLRDWSNGQYLVETGPDGVVAFQAGGGRVCRVVSVRQDRATRKLDIARHRTLAAALRRGR